MALPSPRPHWKERRGAGLDANAAAQSALKQAEDAEYLIDEQYNALFKFWFGTELTDEELEMTADEVIRIVGYRP